MSLLQKIKSQSPDYEGWKNTLRLIKEAMDSNEKIDWEELITAIHHFPSKFRCASYGVHLWSQKAYEPILQIFTRYIVHRASYTAKFGLFSSSVYNSNIEKIALDYKESDDDYVSLGAFVECKTFRNLSHLRIKNLYLTDDETNSLINALDNFPALQEVDLIGSIRRETALIEALEERGVLVQTAATYRSFVNEGFDFWR